jgi:hypothetical protein
VCVDRLLDFPLSVSLAIMLAVRSQFLLLYFVAEEINGSCLLDLTASVLYQMGLKMGAALKIQRIAANLKVIVFLCLCLFADM